MLIVLIQECTGGRGRGGGEMRHFDELLRPRPKSFDQGCFIIPRGTLYNILYRDAPPEKGTFLGFR